jgi:hypothetical protein
MAFDDYERSQEHGRPIEFYIFTLGPIVWRYTTAEQDLVVDEETYLAAAIQGDSVKQTGEPTNDALTIEVPSWIAPAQMFMSAPPTQPIQMSIGMMHAGDTEMLIAYNGEVTQVNFPMPGRARITIESLMTSMQREGLRLGWQRSCPDSLYDPLTCKVSKAAWLVNLTVLTIDGFTLGVNLAVGKPAGHLDNGFIEWNHPARGIEYLAIERHELVTGNPVGEVNARLTLFAPPGELFEGATGSAYPGCAFTPAACQAFGNYPNYGGVPDMPGKSPFDGDPVF